MKRYPQRNIIPPPAREEYSFVSLTVEQGGVGNGTVIRLQMRMLGQLHTFRYTVTEPEPRRVLMETNDIGHVTTFTVEPRSNGQHSSVTIATTIDERPGIVGALERLVVGRLLRPTYRKELAQLASVAATHLA